MSSITSNYGETVSFTYDNEGKLIKVARGALSLAVIEYDLGGSVKTIIGKHKTGYRFYYSTEYAVYLLRGIKTDNALSTVESAMFTTSPLTKNVEFSKNGRTTVRRQYAFNDGGICQSSYQGYCNQQDETCLHNTVAVYAEQQADKARTKVALNYTEDFSQIKNGSFKSITGKNPTNWTVSTTNTGNNYTERYGGNLLCLTEKSTASQSYAFNNQLKTSYVLGFYAEASVKDCSLKVTLSGKSISKTFAINRNGQYYAFIAFDRGTSSNRGTLKFENMSSFGEISLDNVTLSPIDEYAETIWDGGTATQTDKRITQETTYTAKTGDDNRLKEETIIDHYTCNGSSTTNATTVTKTYTYTDATKEGETSKQEILSAIKYRENGTVKTDTQKVLNEYTGTNTKTTTYYAGANGRYVKTYAETDSNIYGYPLRQIGENGEKIYYVYGITQNNYRLLQQVSCNEEKLYSIGQNHGRHIYDYILEYTYNEYGECSQISDGIMLNSITDYHNGGSVLYGGSGKAWKTDTNAYGNPTAIYESGNSLKQIEYTYDSNQSLSRVTYNRSNERQSYADYVYDGYGNLTSEKWYDKNSSTATNSATYTATYDYENKKQTIVSDGTSYLYQADLNGNPLNAKISVSGNQYNANYTYTGRPDGLLSSAEYKINGITRTYTPQYNEKKQIISESDGSDYKSTYEYDAMGRLTYCDLTNGTDTVFANSYTYATNATSGSTYTTARISNELVADSVSIYYNYDAYGRVTKRTSGAIANETYTYDAYNRLYEVTTGGNNGTSYTYHYDGRNNLVEIKQKTAGATAASTYATFSCNRANQLTIYTKEGATKYYEYDNMGNPVKYGVSSTSLSENMIWTQGNKLKSGSYKGNSFSYKYDANGLRYEKTVNGVTTRQYLEDDRIIAEEEVNANNTVVHTKYYIYDQTGIAGMVYDGTPYYFAKNMFGDVVSVHTQTGTRVAGYTYNAWGECKTSSNGSGIGEANPFRYRGYYYDEETGFYYLQSRYYDPEICRFISADNLELVPTLVKIPGQLNLYAYCNNNPIMYMDATGEAILLANF